ncbi:unnamed protein product [Protopolystoma xenopodis]|uniref:Uncharacterized protein n=1 Tax=Protopolystoma xenopodis TaxID=117903 RepID=A0A3S4ZD03_9PLAT|nr:unnamed protein product [Protopolystoma xenopodis]
MPDPGTNGQTRLALRATTSRDGDVKMNSPSYLQVGTKKACHSERCAHLLDPFAGYW